MNTNQESQNADVYEKPTVTSYTEAELLESMEVWGAPAPSGAPIIT